ncbi:hypothetical protein JAAARDRAFT_197783 [Jaapia argillacea MUCL 33604]|uniref:histone acetyltransferase n=1 Tax=Jaapia argillacea MUCL 33604 TaxID=933084 RepID=A0A067PRP5_9AGAM|nr:hypothetical protein JAAARDRAFT_197783 [Jaapia argillacea MUCL 33604]
MPKMNPLPFATTTSSELYIVNKNGVDQLAHVLQRQSGEVYVHYQGSDKRLDEWVNESQVRLADESHLHRHSEVAVAGSSGNQTPNRKRKRGTTSPIRDLSVHSNGGPSGVVGPGSDQEGEGMVIDQDAATQPTPRITEEEFDIQHHKQITAKRNFEHVIFGHWKIKTWYFSPYPLIETDLDDLGGSSQNPRIPGVSRTTLKSHGRTSDILAGGLGRAHATGDRANLWVCDKCFKYMTEGVSWELHIRKCSLRHPPGRKVYQRGAHIIWEVDGAKEKLYCQNLSLFGKLFIDIKTLFFDCDNFFFYLLTDADSQRDHVLGFFSKEKISYDDYNLACIVVLPPYQRKGYGMLMIEFSYEISRRAGKVGTPERPLSDLGLRSYLTYWMSVLIRFFRRLLSVLPPEIPHISSTNQLPDLSRLRSVSADSEDTAARLRRRKSTKGWDGEVAAATDSPVAVASVTVEQDPMFTSLRTIETSTNPDGSATSHVVVKCTLADIAQATNIRIEDAAFALNECGLLLRRRKNDLEGDEGEDTVVVSREMVETVVKERGVKKMMMDLKHVLL